MTKDIDCEISFVTHRELKKWCVLTPYGWFGQSTFKLKFWIIVWNPHMWNVGKNAFDFCLPTKSKQLRKIEFWTFYLEKLIEYFLILLVSY